MGSAILDVEDLEVRRGDFRVRLPRMVLGPGEIAVLLGPSGCGKTSLILAILGLVPSSGRVDLLGSGPVEPRRPEGRRLLFEKVAVVMQEAAASLDPLATVGTQLSAATGRGSGACAEALGELGVADPDTLLDRHPHQLSGGQAQRCLLAVALLRAPKLLIADEPSASLDGGSLQELERNLKLLQSRTGTAILISSHDHRLAAGLQAAPFLFQDGELVAGSLDQAPWRAPSGGADPGPVLLAGRGLSHRYGGLAVLNRVEIELAQGEIVALVGESGAGKSTLARILAGHLKPHEGTVVGPRRRAAVQMLFQDAYGSLTPGRRMRSLLAESCAADFDLESQARHLELDPGQLARTADAMSGGQRRRAALLRSLSVRPSVLILDEPTASLDRDTAVAVTETLLRVQRTTALSMLWVTHDEDWASVFADRTLRLVGGALV